MERWLWSDRWLRRYVCWNRRTARDGEPKAAAAAAGTAEEEDGGGCGEQRRVDQGGQGPFHALVAAGDAQGPYGRRPRHGLQSGRPSSGDVFRRWAPLPPVTNVVSVVPAVLHFRRRAPGTAGGGGGGPDAAAAAKAAATAAAGGAGAVWSDADAQWNRLDVGLGFGLEWYGQRQRFEPAPEKEPPLQGIEDAADAATAAAAGASAA